MTETEIKAQVDAFVALPRKERRATFFSLPTEVQNRARTILEKRRGIAYRTSFGEMVLTPEAYDARIAETKAKLAGLDAYKASLEETVLRLENAKARHYPVTNPE